MLSDARSLWQSFSAAAATINENISTALEKLDLEMDESVDETANGSRNYNTTAAYQQTATEGELEIYKKLLDEAQMEQVELTKRSRVLIAEKDSELLFWKKKSGHQHVDKDNNENEDGDKEPGGGGAEEDSINIKSQIETERLAIDKEVLLGNLQEVESQLRSAITERNGMKVKALRFEEMQSRYEGMRADLQKLSQEMEFHDKQKTETIDNLVSEYSTLAAESELRQNRDNIRINELSQENEVLATRVHALEHSISELADRAVNSSPSISISSATALSASGSSSDHIDAGADITDNSVLERKQQQLQQQLQQQNKQLDELKELRAKIVNLQFDVKEKDSQINRISEQLVTVRRQHEQQTLTAAAAASAGANMPPAVPTAAVMAEGNDNATAALPQAAIEKSQKDADDLRNDIARLQVEKREATDAGKGFLEKFKASQKEVEDLKRQIKEQANASSSNSDSAAAEAATVAATAAATAAAAEAAIVLLKGEVERLSGEKNVLQLSLDNLTVAKESSEQSLRDELECLRTSSERDQKNLTNTLSSTQTELEDKQSRITALEASGTSAQSVVAELRLELSRVTAEAESSARLLASASASSSGQAEETATLMEEIKSLLAAKAAVEEELRVSKESIATLVEELSTLKEHLAKSVAEGEVDLKQAQEKLAKAVAEGETNLRQVQEQAANDLAKAVTEGKSNLKQAQDKFGDDLTKAVTEGEANLKQAQEQAANDLAKEVAEGESNLKQAQEQAANDLAKAVTAGESNLKQAQEQAANDLAKAVTEGEANLKLARDTFEADLVIALKAARDAAAIELSSAVAAVRDDEVSQKKEELRILEETLRGELSLLADKITGLEANLENAASELAMTKERLEVEKVGAVEAERVRVEAVASDKLQAALAEAHAAAAADKSAALSALTEELQKAAREAEAALTDRLVRDKEDAVAAEKAAGEVALLSAVQVQKDSDDVEKQQALETAQQAHMEAMKTAQQEAEDNLVKVKDECVVAVAAADAARDKALQDLSNVELRYEKKMQDALEELDHKKEAEKKDALKHLKHDMQALVDKAVSEKDEYLVLYTKENKLRKSIHNKLLELQGNIRVICRVRPILAVERRSGEDVDVTDFPTEEDIIITKDPQTKARYEFDRVFAPGSTQIQVFDAVQPLCVSVLDGYNVCIFAYGQTGSGKTYTMEGDHTDDEHSGVSPRAVAGLFKIVDSMQPDFTYTLTFSMLEIYNETILDLLDSNSSKDKLDIRQTPEGNVVPGLTEVQVTTAAQVTELMNRGQANRAVGSHDMNEHSSRSHSILTIACRGRNNIDGSSTYGKLHLIDLAGSERISKTDATGDRLKEAQNINRSLSALGDVIAALGNKKATHVPYRNSKLTFLLQDSLGGNSKVLMFVNISPAVYNVGETVCSLTFAARCRAVELGQAKKQAAVDEGAASSSGGATAAATGKTGTMVRRTGGLGSTGGSSSQESFSTPQTTNKRGVIGNTSERGSAPSSSSSSATASFSSTRK